MPRLLSGQINNPMVIEIDSTYSLRGFSLKTTSVPGLTYEFKLHGVTGDTNSETVYNIKYEQSSHTPNMIEFIVRSTGSLPSNAQSMTLFGGSAPNTYMSATLRATLNSQEKTLIQFPYYLK